MTRSANFRDGIGIHAGPSNLSIAGDEGWDSRATIAGMAFALWAEIEWCRGQWILSLVDAVRMTEFRR
jgi:hypothetical protein